MRQPCCRRPRLPASPRAGRYRRTRTNQIAGHSDRRLAGSRHPGRGQQPSLAHGSSSPDDSRVVLSMRMLMRLDDASQVVLAMRVRYEVKFAGAQVFDPMDPLTQTAGCLARYLKHGGIVVELAKILGELLEVEIGVGLQIRFVEDERFYLVEEQVIFHGLVVAFRSEERRVGKECRSR